MEKKSLRKRKTLQNEKRKNAGITLIALVITIVILIILSTITINFAFGENGLVSITENARDITTEATEKEGIEMAVADSKIKDITTPDREKENLEESLRSQFGNDANFTVTENGDGSFLINMNDSQRSYYVESTGEIIAQSEMIEIGTAEELKAFRDEVNSGNSYEGKYIRLTNNITLDIGEEWEPIGLYPVENTSPADETNKPFRGTFDGCGYEIDGIYINTTDKVQGLFGLVNNGKILNLGIGENCNISGGAATAGLVGYLYNEGNIVNCYNKSDIIGNGNLTAGIVGQTEEGLISQCYNSGSINNSSGNYVGGICGNAAINSIVEKCYNVGIINSSKEYIGGICGVIQTDAVIQNCYNAGTIEGGDSRVAGICGENFPETIIQNCYNTGEIIGKNELVGGITGTTGGRISNCYNVGNLSGQNKIGGITGESYKVVGKDNSGIINNTYSLEGRSERICGVIGTDVTIEDSSIKIETEMKALAPTLGSAFEEDTEGINDGYPILSWQ